MDNDLSAGPVDTHDPVTAKPKNEWVDLGTFLLKLVLIVFVLRSFLFSPFSIPSESMQPRLLVGDYLFVSKFSYGFSRHSLPFSVPLLPSMHWADPTRGDVVVFKAPPGNSDDWIKRVIGLPGDTVQVVNGQVILNGKPIPKQRIADFILPITPNVTDCKTEEMDPQGKPVCRVPRFKETLPNGKTYEVLDQGDQPCIEPELHVCADHTQVYTVPKGHVFLMGDNRDNSLDSRFPTSQGGIAYVPMENIEGKAQIGFWSTDGSASWFLPWTWFTAARWSRIGAGF